MKNSILILVFCLFGATAGLAQSEEAYQANRTDFRKRILFGLKGGLNYANVYDSEGDAFEADPKLGLAAGVFVAIPIGRLFGIQPEVLYSKKGFKGQGRLLGSTYQLTRTSTYLDVPLFFAFKPSEFLSILGGPIFSYLIKQNDAFGNTTTTIEQETVFANEDLRKNTLGFSGGVDFTMKHLVFGARVSWDLQKNNVDGTSSTPRYKNVWYQATIGYRFYQD
jgi:hypothetical protein